MRRAAAWAGGIGLTAAVGALGFASWPLSTQRVADRLGGASAPLRLGLPEAVTFRALPWPSLSIEGARLDGADGAVRVTAPGARLDLSVSQLVQGRFAPVRARLANPILTLDLDRAPFAGPEVGLPGAEAAAALAPLDGLSLTDGVLRVMSRKRGLDTMIENIQGRLDGLSPRGRLQFNLSAVWRGTPFAVSGLLVNRERATRGGPSAFELALASPIAALSFKGAFVGGATPGVAGDATVSIPSLRGLARLIDLSPPAWFAGDDVALAATLKASPREAALAGATVTSAGQTFEGALHLVEEVGGRLALSGTLDADRLALAPLIGPARPLLDASGDWSDRPFSLALPQDFDLDLRLSAARLDVYGGELANAAGSLILKNGVLTASLLDAGFYGGRLQGEARIACMGQDLDLRARGAVSDADFGAAFSDLGWPIPGGRGAAEFSLQTVGRTPAAAVVGLDGSISVRLQQGSVAGVNLEEALRRSLRRKIDVDRDMRIGSTAFDRLALDFALGRGVLHVVNGELAAQGVSGNLEGRIDLAGQTWGLHFNAMQTDATGEESQNAAHLSLDIDGPWSQPTIRVVGDKAKDPGAE